MVNYKVTVQVRPPSTADKTKPVSGEVRFGPFSRQEDDERPSIDKLVIKLSDIGTPYIFQSRVNNGSVTEIVRGRAAIGTQIFTDGSFVGDGNGFRGDTYGDSLLSFTEDTVVQSNDNIIRAFTPGGG